MPRYFFDLKNGHRLPDYGGLECKDDGAAIEAGKTIARKIGEEVADPVAPYLIVITSDGRVIQILSITDWEQDTAG